MKLHLGCGKRYIPGFIHVDLANFKHINFKRNVKDLSCFKNNSADLIYACQVLEYFDVDEINVVLKEWRRVLKKDGILRLSVPNFKIISLLYQNKKLKLDKLLGTIYGKWPLSKKSIYHKIIFDFEYLKKILIKNKFRKIKNWDWRQTEHSNIDDYSQAYYPHMDKAKGILFNLNVECKK